MQDHKDLLFRQKFLSNKPARPYNNYSAKNFARKNVKIYYFVKNFYQTSQLDHIITTQQKISHARP